MEQLEPLTKKETIVIGTILALCLVSLITLFVLFGFEFVNAAFNKG